MHSARLFFTLMLAVALAGPASAQAPAGPRGKVTGKLLAADTGEPLGCADVALIPVGVASPKPIGTSTNADGTFTLEAPAGTYTLSARALSYANKSVANVVVQGGATKEISLSLASDAIQQETVVVEGKMAIQFFQRVDGKLVADGEPLVLSRGDSGYVKAGRIHDAKYLEPCKLVYVHDKAFGFRAE